MVTLVEESGAGLPDANSYASLAFADDYFEGHPFYADAWYDLDSDVKQYYLIAATAQLDTQYLWEGTASTTTQGLLWPRSGVRDLYDNLIPPDGIPRNLRRAVCEQAIYLTKGDRSPESQTSSALDKLKVDVIELDFAASTSSSSAGTQPVGSSVRTLLRGLGQYMYGSRIRRVVVA